MKRAETSPLKMLLLPLVPALALGIVEVASHIHLPAQIVTVDTPPVVVDVDPCRAGSCAMPA
jgi:hypothetical protein